MGTILDLTPRVTHLPLKPVAHVQLPDRALSWMIHSFGVRKLRTSFLYGHGAMSNVQGCHQRRHLIQKLHT